MTQNMGCLYFAYGSNMSPRVMEQVCPGHQVIGIGRVDNYRLAFTRNSPKWGGGVADMIPADQMAVYGIVYEVAESCLAALDRKESVARGGYQRMVVTVYDESGQQAREMMTYSVVAKTTQQAPPYEVAPTKAYVDVMLEGATHHRLPAAYIRFLTSLYNWYG